MLCSGTLCYIQGHSVLCSGTLCCIQGHCSTFKDTQCCIQSYSVLHSRTLCNGSGLLCAAFRVTQCCIQGHSVLWHTACEGLIKISFCPQSPVNPAVRKRELILNTSEPQSEHFRSDLRGLRSSGLSELLCKRTRTQSGN